FENKWIPARAPHLPTEAGLAGMTAIYATNLRRHTRFASIARAHGAERHDHVLHAWARGDRLVHRDVRVANHAAPFVALAFRVLGEGFRCSAHGLGSLIGKLLAHGGRGEDRVDLAIEARDNIARRSRRHRDAAPRQRLVPRHTRFAHGRDFRQRTGAPKA